MRFSIAVFTLIILFTGCTSSVPQNYYVKKGTQKPYNIDGKWYSPIASSYGFEQSGIASWYGRDFHGKKTSNGETYDMHAMTAAHKTLPMGTHVKVRRLDNGKETVVRVNDRGPFVDGRIIDLSFKAAKAVGMENSGTTKVRIVALGSTKGDKLVKRDYNKGNFYLQVGAFSSRENAFNLKERLERSYGPTFIVEFNKGGQIFYRVRIGMLDDLDEAESIKNRVRADGLGSPIVIAE